MTSRERIVQAFRHQEPDRTPVFEYVLNSREITEGVLKRPPVFLDWDRYVAEKGWKDAVRQSAVDRLDIAEFFRHDMLYETPNRIPPAENPAPAGCNIPESDDPVEIVEERNRRRRESPLLISDDSFLVYEFLKEEMEIRGIDLPILVPAYSHGVWTDIDLMQTMLLAPEVAHEHFTLATRNANLLIEKYMALNIKMIGVGGDFAGNSPLISPESYRTFIMPELKKLSDMIHSADAYAVNASDGNLWSVIDEFLVGTGVDGYLEIDLHAGMELKKLKQSFGSRITFLGNLDCGNTLSFASPREIRKAVIECLENGMGNGGHILTASNAITDSVPTENYLAAANAYREYFNLDKIQF